VVKESFPSSAHPLWISCATARRGFHGGAGDGGRSPDRHNNGNDYSNINLLRYFNSYNHANRLHRNHHGDQHNNRDDNGNLDGLHHDNDGPDHIRNLHGHSDFNSLHNENEHLLHDNVHDHNSHLDLNVVHHHDNKYDYTL
jgi:hypothetical protein